MLPERPEVVESYFQGIFENVYFLQEGGGYYLTSQAESGDGDCSALLTTTEFHNANDNFIRLVAVLRFCIENLSLVVICLSAPVLCIDPFGEKHNRKYFSLAFILKVLYS